VLLRGIDRVAPSDGRTGLGPLPIGELLHPVALLSVVVLVANDWWAKRVFTGWLTGKLSDVSGLIMAPLALSAAIGGALWLLARLAPSIDPSLHPRRLALAIAATGAVFAATKLSPAAAHAVAAALALLGGHPRIVCDPTDLLALPALALAWWIGRAELRLVPRGRVHAVLRAAPAGAAELRAAFADVRAAGAEPDRVQALEAALAPPRSLTAVDDALRQLAHSRPRHR
jgi:hypothetical protein